VPASLQQDHKAYGYYYHDQYFFSLKKKNNGAFSPGFGIQRQFAADGY
jgi:hypothetical protein